MAELCSVCGEGVLTPDSEVVEVQHIGVKGNVVLSFKKCSYCGCEVSGKDLTALNKQVVNSFKSLVEQKMQQLIRH